MATILRVLLAVCVGAGIAAADTGGARLDRSTADQRPASCGGFRRSVGVLADRAAATVDLRPRLTTVDGLKRLAARVRPARASTPRLPGAERRTYELSVDLVSAARDRSGISLVVRDRWTRTTMSVHLPDPSCPDTIRSRAKRELAVATAALDANCGSLAIGQTARLSGSATIAGVGFFAAPPKRGPRAATRLALSPVLQLSLPGGCRSTLDAVVIAAGDIATSYSSADESTARLLDGLSGTVAALGDNVYDRGTADEFARWYEPTWGRHRWRTRPVPGNHEYLTPGAAGYFAYFGAAAGDPQAGYYSYELGSWHVVTLNTECAVGGCRRDGKMLRWLDEDLARSAAGCTLAYWHVPRFGSGEYGNNEWLADLWQLVYERGVDVVLAGHAHHYERLARQDGSGRRDDHRGVRQFIVGTGGAVLFGVGRPVANSEVINNDVYGVLRLTLRPGSYEWQFLSAGGASFSDSGSGVCH